MSNRADRRKAMKAQPRWKRTMTVEQRQAALVKNGIRPEDVDEAYRKGFEEGNKSATEFSSYAMCAAMGLALNDLYGFGKKRVVRALNLAAKYMFNTFTTREIMEQVYERIGFEFADDPVSGKLVEEIE